MTMGRLLFIHAGANLGHHITYSDTVAVALEAVIAGIPAIAVSLETPDDHIGETGYGPSAHAADLGVSQSHFGLVRTPLDGKNVQNDAFG